MFTCISFNASNGINSIIIYTNYCNLLPGTRVEHRYHLTKMLRFLKRVWRRQHSHSATSRWTTEALTPAWSLTRPMETSMVENWKLTDSLCLWQVPLGYADISYWCFQLDEIKELRAAVNDERMKWLIIFWRERWISSAKCNTLPSQ